MRAEDIANRALDAAGSDMIIGDLEEGSRPAQVCLRQYAPALQRLSRSAHWDALRKQAPLTLLADATGQTANVGNIVPAPWIYEYALPIDCMKARFVPWMAAPLANQAPPGNIAAGAAPLMTGLAQPPASMARLRPARFLVANDYNYPAVQPGSGTDWEDVPGISPLSRTVILTNVAGAQLVYTALIGYPNMWDALFREAMVALLASEIALPLAQDKKLGLQLRAQQIAIAKEKITAARVSDGNEGFYSSDISVDWMSARRSGGAWRHGAGDGGGAGVLGYGWDACGFADGTAF
jgi:hypothetical protein